MRQEYSKSEEPSLSSRFRDVKHTLRACTSSCRNEISHDTSCTHGYIHDVIQCMKVNTFQLQACASGTSRRLGVPSSNQLRATVVYEKNPAELDNFEATSTTARHVDSTFVFHRSHLCFAVLR